MERDNYVQICGKKKGLDRSSSQLIKCKCLEFNVMVGYWSSTSETTTMTQASSNNQWANLLCPLPYLRCSVLGSHSIPSHYLQEDTRQRTVGKRSLWGNWKCLRLVGANKPRLPQMEAVMMFKFISASLWGCLGSVQTACIQCHYYYLNSSTDLSFKCSKCYLLGQL